MRSGPRFPRAAAVLAGLLLVEVATLALLARLGSTAPFDLGADADAWARAAPEDALAAALRWVALAATAWVLLATVFDVALAVVGGVRGASPARRARLAPRAIRRLVDRAIVTGLAAGIAVAPGVAHARTSGPRATPPAVTVVRDGRTGDLASLPADPTTRATTRTAEARAPVPTASVPLPRQAAPVSPMPAHVVVEAGDNLWEIAARELARVRGVARGDVPDVDVAPYWATLCEANRDRLASGAIDVVYPGETVVLPPP